MTIDNLEAQADLTGVDFPPAHVQAPTEITEAAASPADAEADAEANAVADADAAVSEDLSGADALQPGFESGTSTKKMRASGA